MNRRVSGGVIRHGFTRAVVLTIALMTGGCPFIVPTPGAHVNAPVTEVMRTIRPQITTRTDVLMMLGDPNFRIEADRYFVYDWTDIHAIVGLALPGGGLLAGELGNLRALALEFAPDGRVARVIEFDKPDRGSAERELWEDIRAWMKTSDVKAR